MGSSSNVAAGSAPVPGASAASAASNLEGFSYGIAGVSSLGNSFSAAQAQATQGDFQQKVYEMNSKLADYMATDAVRQGDKAVEGQRKQTKLLIGSQRVALAAQGIDIESGSAIQIQDDTRTMSELDVITIKNNAWREAWGYKIQAISGQGQGQFAKIASNTAATNSMLTGGLQFLSYGLRSASAFSGGSSKKLS